MTRTLQFSSVDLNSSRERADGHDFEEGQTPVPPARFAHGTPWPRHALAPEILDEYDASDLALTSPVPREELDLNEPDPLPLIDLDADLGTRTLMGVGARAVRSVAKAGWVEARPARREPRATPGAAYSHADARSMPAVSAHPTPARVIVTPLDATEGSSRRTFAQGSSRAVEHAPPVQPIELPPEEIAPAPAPVVPFIPEAPAFSGPVKAQAIPAHLTARIGAAEARVIASIAEAEPVSAPARRPRAARAKGKRASSGYRVLGISFLALAVLALGAYIATTVFFAFSTSWVMPAVVSQSDDRVVALKTGLAAQQNQRDRLAAELEETARTIAAQKDPRSDVAQKALAHEKLLRASVARQDEIIRGLEQSPYLRAIADRAHVALVPYDNLDSVAPGTAVLACRVAMVMCGEVGRVIAVLPGEVTFKHPRREKMMRGQMIELRLSEPDAAAADVLFLGGSPLGF